MGTASLNRIEVRAVRALAPEQGTHPARLLRRMAPLADDKLPWLVASAVLFAAKRRHAVVPVVLGWAGVGLSSLVATAVVEPLVQRRRPDPARLGDHVRAGDEPSSTSMPSSHTASGIAFAAVVTAELPPAWPLLPVAGAIAVGRVVSARHFPTDVAAGAVLGGATAGGVLAAGRYVRSHPGRWLGPLLRRVAD
jgi:membrane-associated phospholipid phosphatase